MKKPLCYIAGKIGGLDEEQYTAKFNQAKQEVIQMGFTPVNPLELPHRHNRTWNDYMKEDLRELTKCDFIYVIRNWRDSNGAKVEVETAVNLGINVIFQENNVKMPSSKDNEVLLAHHLGFVAGIILSSLRRPINLRRKI